jgi:hypothetical protein
MCLNPSRNKSYQRRIILRGFFLFSLAESQRDMRQKDVDGL